MESIFINDNYFKAYPEKVLGVPYETSGRFGKVTKYKGTIEDVERINVPHYTPAPYGEGLARSIEQSPKSGGSTMSNNEAQNVKNAIEKAQKERNTIRTANEKIESDLITFEEIDATYNKHISEGEKIAFVWYMRNVLRRPMEGGWKKYHRNMDSSQLAKMVKEGVLMYEKGTLIPAFMYFSGNIYQKFSQIERDKDEIIEKYCEGAYEAQQTHLKAIKDEIYGKRMILDAPNPDDRLKILPTSEFAQKFKIKFLKDEVEIRANVLSKGVAWNNDVEKNFTTFKEASLQEAFIFWMKNNSAKIPFRFGLDWLTIYELGVYDKKYVKSGDKDDDDSAEKEEFKKKKAKAKMEAKRIFSDFLANELDLNDKVRIETQWNQQYNANYLLDLNRVPIGFTIARTYAGLDMDIRPEKREAIAFAMMQGSGCLNYGVGLGKTWCAIFIFAQFLENGWALRPLLAVPNQVYKQFMNEIRGILPHIPVNDFYNLSDKYLDNVPKEAAFYADQKNYIGIYKNGEDATKMESEKENLESFFSFIENYSEQDRKLQVYPMPDTDKYFRPHNGYHFVFKAEDVIESNKFGSVPMKSISIVTYEGLRRIGINESSESEFWGTLYDIMAQNNESSQPKSTKKAAKEFERMDSKLKAKIGKGQIGTEITIQALGIDMLTVDEAHSMKKIFTEVKGEGAEDGKQNKRAYKITSGTPSVLAIKGFMLSQYIQHKNGTGNVIILTATPFTNSPLEVYSMVSLIGFKYLKEVLGLANLQDFFDQFVEVRYELVIDAKLKPVMKEIFTGFNNLPALQGLIKKFFLYKLSTKETKRPNKIVLPLRQRSVNGVLMDLDNNEKVDTILEMSPLQRQYMDDILAYAEGKTEFKMLMDAYNLKDFDDSDSEDDDKIDAKKDDESDISDEKLSNGEKAAVRLLRAMAYSRAVALSPYLFKPSGDLNYRTYVETSAKLNYTMQCIRSVKEYHEAKNEPVSGQVIYMNRGVKYFDLVKEYLIKEVGYKEHEIGIIRSQMPKGKDKAWVQDRFLGRKWNETTREHEPIPDSERIKIIIGSATIKEGLNLQKYGTVLYNLFLDWNPTDVIQLEGRIWRQGNLFENIRIVTPLLEDSMDIFMFQKLEEKTLRINAIWDYDNNTQTLNLEDFNPGDLKYALIKDAGRVAELENQEIKERIEDEITILKTDIAVFNEFIKIKDDLQNYVKRKYEWIEYWRDVEPVEHYQESPLRFQNLVTKIMSEGVLKDGSKVSDIEDLAMDSYSKGISIPVKYVSGRFGQNERVKNGVAKIIEPYDYYMTWKVFKDKVRRYSRIIQDILKPKNINPNGDNKINRINDENGYYTDNTVRYRKEAVDPTSVSAFVIMIESKIHDANQRIKALSEKEYINARAAEITQKRLEAGLSSATIEQRVKEFERLNYLLSLRKYETKVVPMPTPSVSQSENPQSEMFELIEALRLSVEYLQGKEKTETLELIEALEISLNYLKAA